MEQLVTGLSHITLDPTYVGTYATFFNDIIHFAEKVRGHKIPADERDVTENLAMPFTTGGLLVLLMEPRQNHPWHEGVDCVITECRSLASLNEGIEVGSKGELSLKNGVSVLDLRPFLPKKQHPNLKDDVWKEVYKRVFRAIEAKRPKVLLCMGDEAKAELTMRIQEDRDRYQDTQIVYSMHPSCAVNYHKDDLTRRDNLFKSICEACYGLNNDWDDDATKERFVTHTLGTTEFMFAENTECLGGFLDVLLKSCFLPRQQLPSHNILVGKSQRYELKHWHKSWFKHLEKDEDSTNCREHQARAYLIPVFKQLNVLFRRTSWFLPIYEVADWQRVRRVLVDRLSEIESRCYLLAGGTEADTNGTARNDRLQRIDRGMALCHELNRITAHFTRLWEARQPHPVRNSRYIGISDPFN